MQLADNCLIELKGYIPGAIGAVVQLHAAYYSQCWGLNLAFEAEVAAELSKFLLNFDSTCDGFWVATVQEKIVGAIAINGNRSHKARLRWFIVASEYQGYGIGQKLIETAIQFCRSCSFHQVHLWTFSGLSTARHVYERNGFILDLEQVDDRWEKPLLFQKFSLTI